MAPPDDVRHDQPTTLADIAAASGFAVSTVSRALSNPTRVNAATRERIQRLAAELGYLGHAAARSPEHGRALAVAVLVSGIHHGFHTEIIRGTQRQLRAAGYAQILIDTEGSEELEDELVHTFRRSFDGAILASSRLSDRRLFAIASEMPLVAINRQTRGVPSVIIDTPRGVEQAVDHLVALGHRSICYASGPAMSWPNVSRWRALLRAATHHGVRTSRVGPFPTHRTAGIAAADALLNTGATACIAFNDLLALGMLTRLGQRGVSVPGDISIVGCDDIFGAEFSSPPLTTISAPIERAGRAAVSMLFARLESPAIAMPHQHATVPAHLTVRASTGPAPVARR